MKFSEWVSTMKRKFGCRAACIYVQVRQVPVCPRMQVQLGFFDDLHPTALAGQRLELALHDKGQNLAQSRSREPPKSTPSRLSSIGDWALSDSARARSRGSRATALLPELLRPISKVRGRTSTSSG